MFERVLEIPRFTAARVGDVGQRWQRAMPLFQHFGQQAGQHFAHRGLPQLRPPRQIDGRQPLAGTVENRDRGDSRYFKNTMLVLSKRDAVAAHGDDGLTVSTAEIRLLQRLQQRFDLRCFSVFRESLGKSSNKLPQAFHSHRHSMLLPELL